MMTNRSMTPQTALYWCAAIFAGGVLGGLLYTQGLDWYAQHQARKLAAAIRPGVALSELRIEVNTQGGWLDLNNLTVVRVGFDGWHRQCRCSISMRGDKVASVSRVVCAR